MIHPLADCMNKNIPETTNIWQFCVIFKDAIIGENCNICAGVLIENNVIIGDNVTIKCYVEVPEGTILEDNVFIGPNVSITNDSYPRSKQHPEKYERIIIKKGASVGGGVSIVPGITIGANSMIGAGSVVTKDIPDNELWIGNPAKFIRKIDLS